MIPNIPDTLPPPVVTGYSYRRKEQFIRTDMDSGLARQRRRFQIVPTHVNVQWRFSGLQLALFEGWIEHYVGIGWFYSKLSAGQGLQSVKARFIESPSISNETYNVWTVAATLETIEMPIISVDEVDILSDKFGLSSLASLHKIVHYDLPGEMRWD